MGSKNFSDVLARFVISIMWLGAGSIVLKSKIMTWVHPSNHAVLATFLLRRLTSHVGFYSHGFRPRLPSASYETFATCSQTATLLPDGMYGFTVCVASYAILSSLGKSRCTQAALCYTYVFINFFRKCQ